jgi:hypothetical protein
MQKSRLLVIRKHLPHWLLTAMRVPNCFHLLSQQLDGVSFFLNYFELRHFTETIVVGRLDL